MGTAELSQRTTVNIQEKANLIWAIADKLVGTYKPHEYGNVILPMRDSFAKLFEEQSFYNRVMEEMGKAMYFNLKNSL